MVESLKVSGKIINTRQYESGVARGQYDFQISSNIGEFWIYDVLVDENGNFPFKQGDCVEVGYFLKKGKYPTALSVKKVSLGSNVYEKPKEADRGRLIVRQTALKVAGGISAVVGVVNETDKDQLARLTIAMARKFEKYILEG